MEDVSDVSATAMIPKLYFFPWITKPVMNDTTEFMNSGHNDGHNDNQSSESRPDSSCDTNSSANSNQQSMVNGHPSPDANDDSRVGNGANATIGGSTFQFIIEFNILPVVGEKYRFAD